MRSNLPKKYRCFFAYAQCLPPGAFAALSRDARAELKCLVEGAIEDVISARPNARVGTIVNLVVEEVQYLVDEILVRDQDNQHVAKIIDAAMCKFPATYDLGEADEATLDKVACELRDHMEQVAWDWELSACTSISKVLDDLIREATKRARPQIEAILSRAELDQDEDEECEI